MVKINLFFHYTGATLTKIQESIESVIIVTSAGGTCSLNRQRRRLMQLIALGPHPSTTSVEIASNMRVSMRPHNSAG